MTVDATLSTRKSLPLPAITDAVVVRQDFVDAMTRIDRMAEYNTAEEITSKWIFDEVVKTAKGIGYSLTNNTGATRAAGDVVINDTAVDLSFILPTAIGVHASRVMVVAESINNAASGLVTLSGYCIIKTDGGVTRGQWLQTKNGVAQATGTNTFGPGCFAIALTAPDGSNFVAARFVTGTYTTGSGSGLDADTLDGHDTAYFLAATHASASTIDHPDNSIPDVKIGSRTSSQSTPMSSNSGTLTNFISAFATQLHRIIGKTNWYDTVDTDLHTISLHLANTSNPHSVTYTQTGALGATASAGGELAGNYPNPTIATKTAVPTNAPSSSGPGTYQNFIDWLTNRIKAITGTTNWYDTPGTTLAATATHIADTGNPHTVTAVQVGALGATAAAGGDLAGNYPNPTIANKTANTSTSPSTDGPGSYQSWINWLTTRIRLMLGTTNWYDAVPISLTTVNAHVANNPGNPHNTTAAMVSALGATAAASGDLTGNYPSPTLATRIPDESITALSSAGTYQNIMDWLANRIKAITGATHWYSNPAVSLATVATHIADLDGSPSSVHHTLGIDGLHAAYGNHTHPKVNLLVNGGFERWQRGDGPFTTNNAFTADRWQLNIGAGHTASVSPITPSPKHTGSNRTLYLQHSGVAATESVIFQKLKISDGFNLNGEVITFGVDILCSTAGLQARIIYDGTGASEQRSSASVATGSWQTLTVSATIPQDATYAEISIITGVVLEAEIDNAILVLGPNAAQFQPEDPQTELARCQRYYETISCEYGNPIGSGMVSTVTSVAIVHIPFKVKKAITTPAYTLPTASAIQILAGTNGGFVPASALAVGILGIHSDGLFLEVTPSGGISGGSGFAAVADGSGNVSGAVIAIEANP